MTCSAAFLLALVRVQNGFQSCNQKVSLCYGSYRSILHVACGRVRIVSAINYDLFFPRKLN